MASGFDMPSFDGLLVYSRTYLARVGQAEYYEILAAFLAEGEFFSSEDDALNWITDNTECKVSGGGVLSALPFSHEWGQHFVVQCDPVEGDTAERPVNPVLTLRSSAPPATPPAASSQPSATSTPANREIPWLTEEERPERHVSIGEVERRVAVLEASVKSLGDASAKHLSPLESPVVTTIAGLRGEIDAIKAELKSNYFPRSSLTGYMVLAGATTLLSVVIAIVACFFPIHIDWMKLLIREEVAVAEGASHGIAPDGPERTGASCGSCRGPCGDARAADTASCR